MDPAVVLEDDLLSDDDDEEADVDVDPDVDAADAVEATRLTPAYVVLNALGADARRAAWDPENFPEDGA
jgi:hypothetical protein